MAIVDYLGEIAAIVGAICFDIIDYNMQKMI